MSEAVYVLIQCDLGSEEEIIRDLGTITSITEVRGTYGIYDIFCRIAADDRNEIDRIVTEEIRRMPRIRATITLHCIPSQGGR